MAHRIPLYTSANGLHRVTVAQEHTDSRTQVTVVRSLHENTWIFTNLASAANIGMEILESRAGKEALADLGCLVVQEWTRTNTHRFGGDIRHMAGYVHHFLSSLRADFPNIIVGDIGGPDAIAVAKRMPGNYWDGNLTKYRPKVATGIYYNQDRVADMVHATDKMWENRNGKTPEKRQTSAKMLQRHKMFQFLFAVGTVHEMCHAFVGYLAQNSLEEESYTPQKVTHLNYAPPPALPGGLRPGESGRWFENKLFGGSFEFYYDVAEDRRQVGIPHILNKNAVAWMIDPAAIDGFIKSPRTFEFPLRVCGEPLDFRARQRLGLRSLGQTRASTPPPVRSSFMRARREGPELMYDINQTDLDRIPTAPTPLRATRVA